MHSGTAEPQRQRPVTVEQYARTRGLRDRQQPVGKASQPLDRPGLLAQLNELQASRDRHLRAAQKDVFAEVLGHRDAVDQRQLECAQNDGVRGEQRRHVECARRLPGERLTHAAARLAAPSEDTEEIELDIGVRISVALYKPRRRTHDPDSQFLIELARERDGRRFARFELATGKLPVAGIRRAGEPLREQHAAVGPLQNGDGHLHDT